MECWCKFYINDLKNIFLFFHLTSFQYINKGKANLYIQFNYLENWSKSDLKYMKCGMEGWQFKKYVCRKENIDSICYQVCVGEKSVRAFGSSSLSYRCRIYIFAE